MGATGERTRVRGDERREQLLDVAAQLVARGGAGAVTMEGLAAAAGVAKALPYRHFANADGVLVALAERCNRHLATALTEAVDAAGRSLPDRMAAAVRAYVDVVKADGPVLAHLSSVPAVRVSAAVRQDAASLHRELFTTRFAVPAERAVPTAEVAIGAMAGAAAAWAARRASRAECEALATAAAVAAVQAARAADRA